MLTSIQRFGLSARTYDRLLKVARTIADLGGASEVASSHSAEGSRSRSSSRMRGVFYRYRRNRNVLSVS